MHCPHCGRPIPEGSIACPHCGAALAPPGGAAGYYGMKPAARTMVGVTLPDLLRQTPSAPADPGGAGPGKAALPPMAGGPGAASRTIVGMPAAIFGPTPAQADPRLSGGTLVVGTPAAVAPGARFDAPAAPSAPPHAAPSALPHAAPPHAAPSALPHAAPPHAAPSALPHAAPPHAAPSAPPHAAPGELLHAAPAAPLHAAPGELRLDRTAPIAPGLAAPRGPMPLPAVSRTLVGVARPGIAPLAPGAPAEPGPDPELESRYQPAGELGATIAPLRFRAPPLRNPALMRPHRLKQRLPPPQAERRPRTSRRAVAVVVAGGVLALGAVLFALLWPSAPPVTARARADAGGREVIELRCESCPDGTAVSIGEGRATVAGRVAQIPLASPLSVGENRMKVAIDRPGSGRDETVGVSVHVAYRIRPDLGTLQGERPSIQVVVEASNGTQVILDGREVALTSGRAVESIDVTDAVAGLSDETKTLSRQVPYTVTPPDGAREQGMVSVAVGIVPLTIEAPGPSVVIDKESFVLAGRTARGAQIFAGAHPITVRPDGTFAHVMNVSSVGATQFEVRAKMQGMAPRIAKIAVRRVDRLDTAAKEFAGRGPIGYPELAAGGKDAIGKPIALTGEVLEVRRQGYATLILLSVPPASGCKEGGATAASASPGAAPRSPDACKVRLVHGAENPAQRGDILTAYGNVAPPFVAPGGAEIPEVAVEFTVKGAR
ncbi:zinc-ribbon domain-containing protein [Sorangium sp. So ce1000]|uniref:zinc-ribbon domain-containing protein n=1 Tax=Sorangium sp. So ce1000 TaxID=3133325 RepID=UPI003F5F985F